MVQNVSWSSWSLTSEDLTGQPALGVDKYGKTPGAIYRGETKPYETPKDDDKKEGDKKESKDDDKDTDDDTGYWDPDGDCPKGVLC